MNKQELKQQLSELSTAANSLANALTVLHTNVSIDVPNVATHHCGQDAKCQVGDGSAAVNEIPDSLKSLEGMQVIKVCSPKCKDCPCGDGPREYPSGRDMSSCVKVEIIGCYYLCLAPLPNSIVTE